MPFLLIFYIFNALEMRIQSVEFFNYSRIFKATRTGNYQNENFCTIKHKIEDFTLKFGKKTLNIDKLLRLSLILLETVCSNMESVSTLKKKNDRKILCEKQTTPRDKT